MEGQLKVTIELLPTWTGVDQPSVDKVLHNVVIRSNLELDFHLGRVPTAIRQARGDDDRTDEVPVTIHVEGGDLYRSAGVLQGDEALPTTLTVVGASRDSRPEPRGAGGLTKVEAR